MTLILDNLDDALREKLRERAQRHGRSIEDEARDILRSAVVEDLFSPNGSGEGLGTRITNLFRDCPIPDDINFEVHDGPAKPFEFDA